MTVRLQAPTERTAPSAADLLLDRIRGEYRDMPGLQLTHAQAVRLLGLDPMACLALLEQLSNAGFLRRRDRGQYVLADGR
jgi:hypothetical protein